MSLAFALRRPVGSGAGAESGVEDPGLLSVPLSTPSPGVWGGAGSWPPSLVPGLPSPLTFAVAEILVLSVLRIQNDAVRQAHQGWTSRSLSPSVMLLATVVFAPCGAHEDRGSPGPAYRPTETRASGEAWASAFVTSLGVHKEARQCRD